MTTIYDSIMKKYIYFNGKKRSRISRKFIVDTETVKFINSINTVKFMCFVFFTNFTSSTSSNN